MRGKVRAIIFDVPLKPAGNLRLAEMEDGRYAILRDDSLLDGKLWPAEEVEASVSAFRAAQRTLSGSNGQSAPPDRPAAGSSRGIAHDLTMKATELRKEAERLS